MIAHDNKAVVDNSFVAYQKLQAAGDDVFKLIRLEQVLPSQYSGSKEVRKRRQAHVRANLNRFVVGEKHQQGQDGRTTNNGRKIKRSVFIETNKKSLLMK